MKTTAILIASLLLLLNASAQKTNFGIKGGINASNLHFVGNTNTDSKLGFNLGLLAHLHASKTWAIQPEIIYSLEGNSENFSNVKITFNLNYINIPVLLQYMFRNGFRLEGGPQLGFLISKRIKSSNPSALTVTNSHFESTAFSIPLGISYLTSSGLGLDVRYVFGLSNINGNENGAAIQSNVFQLGLFYQFTDTKIHRHHSKR